MNNWTSKPCTGCDRGLSRNAQPLSTSYEQSFSCAGQFLPRGRRKLERAVEDLLGDEANGLSPRMRQLSAALRDEWKILDERTTSMNAEFIAIARNDQAMCRLTTILGIRVLNATALVAAIGNADSFRHARDLEACLGLVPQQHSTGSKARLLGNTKRGNT